MGVRDDEGARYIPTPEEIAAECEEIRKLRKMEMSVGRSNRPKGEGCRMYSLGCRRGELYFEQV
jgi:hypothetical protein